MSFWTNRKVFVTGGTGLMGRWLINELQQAGADLFVLLRRDLPAAAAGNAGRCTAITGDIRDLEAIRQALTGHEIDTVFHLAAQAIVGKAKADPAGTLDTNVRGTWSVLEAARSSQVRQIVVASSERAYGSRSISYDETYPLEGRQPYDCSKSCGDLVTMMYASTYKLPACIVRCANLYGGGDLNFDRVIPGVIQATIKGKPFVIRSDGKFIRDFLYVKDAALGCMLAAERLAEDRTLAGEAFNLSMEVRLTVKEVVSLVLRLMNREDIQPVTLNEASSEHRERYIQSAKARQQLNWQPAYSLEEGLRETIEWYRKYFAESAASPALAGATA